MENKLTQAHKQLSQWQSPAEFIEPKRRTGR